MELTRRDTSFIKSILNLFAFEVNNDETHSLIQSMINAFMFHRNYENFDIDVFGFENTLTVDIKMNDRVYTFELGDMEFY